MERNLRLNIQDNDIDLKHTACHESILEMSGLFNTDIYPRKRAATHRSGSTTERHVINISGKSAS